MLNVKDLIVFYENAIAVNDLSMEVREGQIVGVIGSNSAGKTTLMNTLSGLIWDMLIKEQRKERRAHHGHGHGATFWARTSAICPPSAGPSRASCSAVSAIRCFRTPAWWKT